MASLGMAATTVAFMAPPRFHLASRSVTRLGSWIRPRTAPGTSRISRGFCGISCSSSTGLDVAASVSVHSVKDFLEDLKAVGRVRIIVNTGVGVLESVVNGLEGLFYKEFPGKGEYANLMIKEENVDFHLLVDKVASVKLIQGTSMQGNIPTYMARFYDSKDVNVASVMVMWRSGGGNEYDNGQVNSFKKLLEKYGSDIKFLSQ